MLCAFGGGAGIVTRNLIGMGTALVAGAIASDDIHRYIDDALNLHPYYETTRALLAEYRQRAATEGTTHQEAA